MERVNRILRDEEYCSYLEKNRAWEEKRPFCHHDLAHFLAVARLTYLLLLEKDCRIISKEVAYGAGLLHDIGRWKEYERGGDHARHSAALAAPILQRAGFHPAEIALITAAIGQHRLDAPEGHRSPLGEALHKADGLARICFSCSARQECRGLERRPQRESLIY
ncbi:MAG: HD domain-containing protein [Firmicutes bacterium]|jgi:HD superfamily phosphodiesterase|nr:HD domain-containing protein [Bacillota bacterium]HPU00725.1 HD domain-containing protein [Bacillota bacterium]